MPPEKRPRVRQADDTFGILFVGRITYNKGLQYLLKALARLESMFRLEVAGQGWYLERAESLAQDLGIRERTLFLGNVVGADLTRAYERSDVVVIPSIWPEPVGLVVGEARMLGVPVVVTDAGGLPEWADGDPGVVVAPRADAAGLAAVIRHVRKQPTIVSNRARRSRRSLSEVVNQVLQETLS
jgi:glycosyltransferase involved in cell wall biosynthesis